MLIIVTDSHRPCKKKYVLFTKGILGYDLVEHCFDLSNCPLKNLITILVKEQVHLGQTHPPPTYEAVGWNTASTFELECV